MPVLRSSVDTGSETYRHNRRVQLAAVAALNEQLELARARRRRRGRGRDRERPERGRVRLRKRRFVSRAIYRQYASPHVIAAANGTARAGGFLLAQCCDLCIAADSATFAVSEVKVGRGAPWAAPLSWLTPPRIALRPDVFDAAEEIWAPVYLSADAQEGPAAFRDKRQPVWTGR